MLGSTARKLRILGYDTVYDGESNDEFLLQEALSLKRILLTSDVELSIRSKVLRVRTILVTGHNEEERLFEILSKAGITQVQLSNLKSRCSLCNGELLDTASKNLNGLEIYGCTSCGKEYWQGSHWRKMKALFASVNVRLIKSLQEESER